MKSTIRLFRILTAFLRLIILFVGIYTIRIVLGEIWGVLLDLVFYVL